MKVIMEQDVLKAFYRFDCKKLPVMDINGRLSPSLDVMMRKKLCIEWLDAFSGLETILFEKAVQIALERSKQYPSLDEMFEYIALAEGNAQPITEKPKERLPSGTELKAERIKAMVAAAKTGDYKTAYQYAAAVNNSSERELVDFIKDTWPHATQEWIAENRCEIKNLIQQQKACEKCGSVRRCNTKGYKLCWSIGEKGELVTAMQPCYMRKAGNINENIQ